MKPRIIYLNSGRGIELQNPSRGELRHVKEVLSRRDFIRRASGLIVPVAILGGLALPQKARGSSTILSRTISSANQNAISMANSTWARPVALPSGWNKIRIGIRFHCDGTGATLAGNPIFVMGFCSGTSNQYGDATTTHWIGAAYDYTSYVFNSGPYYGGNTLYARVRVSTTNTSSVLNNTGNSNFSINANAGSNGADRQISFLDITHGSPNYTFSMPFWVHDAVGGDVSAANFLSYMGLGTPVPSESNYTTNQLITPPTLAVSESTNGTLNAINCYWNRVDATMEITDVAVAVLS